MDRFDDDLMGIVIVWREKCVLVTRGFTDDSKGGGRRLRVEFERPRPKGRGFWGNRRGCVAGCDPRIDYPDSPPFMGQ
jgi:hypothetical protein